LWAFLCRFGLNCVTSRSHFALSSALPALHLPCRFIQFENAPWGIAMKNRKDQEQSINASDPLWYKDAIIYELHVRAFHDTNGDGIGDIRGVIEKLDYLQDVGVTALWLLPFYPSPLRDDGYDIADYTDVNEIYGSLADMKALLREAHRRGMRVI